jgi:hypothetical protein
VAGGTGWRDRGGVLNESRAPGAGGRMLVAGPSPVLPPRGPGCCRMAPVLARQPCTPPRRLQPSQSEFQRCTPCCIPVHAAFRCELKYCRSSMHACMHGPNSTDGALAALPTSSAAARAATRSRAPEVPFTNAHAAAGRLVDAPAWERARCIPTARCIATLDGTAVVGKGRRLGYIHPTPKPTTRQLCSCLAHGLQGRLHRRACPIWRPGPSMAAAMLRCAGPGWTSCLGAHT